MNLKLLLGPIGALGVAAVLAACAGNTSSVPQSTSSIPLSGAQQPMGVTPDKCGHQHGVSVRPCHVLLTVTNPTATVTVKGPSGGTFVARDARCTKRDIATVAGAASTYTVTAGTTSGSCVAKFVDKDTKGHPIGAAQLSITNKV